MATPNIVLITDIENARVNGKPFGSITNVLLNKNATVQETHDALKAWVAAKDAEIAAAKSDAAAATAALNTLQGQVDTIVEAAIAAGSDITKLQAVVAQASPLSSASRLAAKQAQVAKLQAALEAAQAAVAVHMDTVAATTEAPRTSSSPATRATA